MTSMLTRRDFLRTVGAGLAGATLLGAAGCGGGQQGGRGGGGGKVTLTFWHYYAGPTTKPLMDLLHRYEKSNPKVKVKARLIPFDDFNRTLLQSATGGNLPDIALVNAFDVQSFAKAGILQDLTSRAKKWGQGDKYFQTSWDTCLYEGKNYGLPHVVDDYVLWYNEDLLKKAGVKPPDTWDELGNVARRLSEGKGYGFAASTIQGAEGATAWVIRLLASGGDVTNIDGAAGHAAMEQWVNLVKSGAMSREALNWSEDDVYNQFANGQAAMMINSATYVNVLKNEHPDLKWKVVLLPKAQKRATFLSSEDLTVTTGSQNVDAAWDLMTYMQKPKVLNKYLPERNKLPARKDVASKPPWSTDPVFSVFVKQLDQAWAPDGKIASQTNEILTDIQEAIQAAVGGNTGIDTALSRAQKKITSALKG